MSNPRIISGGAKGMILKPVPGDSTRPVTDRVKEAVFNIIGRSMTSCMGFSSTSLGSILSSAACRRWCRRA